MKTKEEIKKRKAEWRKKDYAKQRDRYLEWSKQYRKNNREHCRKRDAKWYADNRLLARQKRIQQQFGLTPEQFNALLVKQGNRCAICGKHFEAVWGIGLKNKNKRPHVDHDHVTGKVRGLLCSNCNLGLGVFSDNLATVLNAACYLEKPPNG